MLVDSAHRLSEIDHAALLRDLGRTEEAEAAYRAVLAVEPDAWQALLGLAQCARQRRDLVAAAEHLTAALAAAPQERWVLLDHAALLRDLGRTEEAEAAYRAVLAVEPDAWQALLGLAQCARQQNNYQNSLKLLEDALEFMPDLEAPWLEVAREYEKTGHFKEARATLRSLVDRNLAGELTWIELGVVERLTGDHTSALKKFQEAYAHYPDSCHILFEMALEAKSLGFLADAKQWLRDASKNRTLTSISLVTIGEIELSQEHFQEALNLFQNATLLPSSTIWAQIGLAQTLVDLGRREEAISLLEETQQRVGFRPEIATRQAYLLRRAGFFHEAISITREAVQKAPNDFALWFEWFEIERRFGDIREIGRIFDTPPCQNIHDRAMVHFARALLAEQCCELENASRHLREALSLDPLIVEAYEMQARLSMLKFDVCEARANLLAWRNRLAPIKRSLGFSPHLGHSHIGNIYNEFASDDEILATLAEIHKTPLYARIEQLLNLVKISPDHTPTAIALIICLRQSGNFIRNTQVQENSFIPKLIVQYWDDSVPPKDVTELMSSWREQNPDYRYFKFDHITAQQFLKKRYSSAVQHAYMRAREAATKADLFRLAYLFAEGGYYADADDRCLRPLTTLEQNGITFLAYQEEYGIGNNFLAAAPSHPVIGLALNLAVEAINRGDDEIPWMLTGPGVLTRAFAQILSRSLLLPDALLERSRIFLRYEMEQVVAMHCLTAYKKSRRHWMRVAYSSPESGSKNL